MKKSSDTSSPAPATPSEQAARVSGAPDPNLPAELADTARIVAGAGSVATTALGVGVAGILPVEGGETALPSGLTLASEHDALIEAEVQRRLEGAVTARLAEAETARAAAFQSHVATFVPKPGDVRVVVVSTIQRDAATLLPGQSVWLPEKDAGELVEAGAVRFTGDAYSGEDRRDLSGFAGLG